MTTNEIRRAYQAFFLKSEAGQHYMNHIQTIIQENHTKAEDQPELARDYVQRAKGVREIMAHIQSLTADPKGGQPRE